MSNFAGITLGPLYKTISSARETREVWASSYIFSYITKQICIRLRENNYEVISPYFEKAYKNTTGVGLYPERVYVELSENASLSNLVKLTEDVIGDFCSLVYSQLYKKSKITDSSNIFKYDSKDLTGVNVSAFIKSYLKYYIVECAIDKPALPHQEGILKPINQALDIAELNEMIPRTDTSQFLFDFFYRVSDCDPLIADAFSSKANGKSGIHYHHFKSVFEIAAYDLMGTWADDHFNQHFQKVGILEAEKKKPRHERNYTRINIKNKELKSFLIDFKKELAKHSKESNFLPYHKYFVVAFADGDNVGKAISSLKTNDSINAFSKQFFEFGKKAAESIEAYGGLPVYVGGEDLFFMAPFVNKKGNTSKHIFQLVNEIDQLFGECGKNLEAVKAQHDQMIEYERDGAKGDNLQLDNTQSKRNIYSLSYGISIIYYKHPLYEAIKSAKNNLDNIAKKVPSKNTMAFSFQKHSGQKITACLKKGDANYFKWLEFLNVFGMQAGIDSNFINGLTHKIEDLNDLMRASIATNGSISCFLKKTFNDDPHSDSAFMKALEILAEDMYKVDPNNGSEMIYSLLRLIGFMNKKTDD